MQNENILLTVIITVFNVESYLNKCIDSVRKQNYKHMEILLIDDGSTDGSSKICDEYAQKDERIRVYHKENGGLVSARKEGVNLAKGEVITFVDADDWIDTDMYQCMMEEYDRCKPDLVSSGIMYEWGDRTEYVLDGISKGTYEKAEIWASVLPSISYNADTGIAGVTSAVWNKLFRASLLKKVIKKIDIELTQGEDGALAFLYIAHAERITVMNRAWYHYVQRENSLIRENDFRTFEKIFRLENNLMHGFEELGLGLKMKQQIKHYTKTFLYNAIRRVYNIEMNELAFIFPYECVPKGSRIILYGAGRVGRAYYKCIQYGEYVTLVGWVDKNYRKLQEDGLEIEPPQSIMSKEFDYIVIAVNFYDIADEIRGMLIKWGINENKIIWKQTPMVH